MKLITLLLTVACLHVSASSLGQRITLNKKNAPLSEVVKAIQRQSGYQFFYKGDELNHTKVSVELKNATVQQAMDQALKGLPFSYKITDKIIVIQQKAPAIEPKPQTSGSATNQAPADHDVRVHVTDSTGEPLSGASVIVKGTTQGGMTDQDGNITLSGMTGDEILIISFTGYTTKEIPISDHDALTVFLSVSANSLEDVVVNKGYYTTTQRINTGNVSVVKGEDIQKQPVSDPLAALQGRVPGLYIRQQSGAPGNSFDIMLRGKNSIANGNNPLFIVDGVPFTSSSLSDPSGLGAILLQSPFNSLNINAIENIEVLKDADATAIYGSRGANGVILITTKKGTPGKTKIDIDLYQGTGKVTSMLKMMNTQQYLAMRHEALKNDNIETQPWDYDINGIWDTTRYTNWGKLLIGGNAHVTNANISISGGNKQTQFIIGSGYRNESTVFPGNFFDRKISSHFRLTHESVNKKFNLSLSADYINDNNQMPLDDFTQYLTLAPDAPEIYDSNGQLNWENDTWQNPMASILKSSKAITNNLLGNIVLNYRILPGLSVKTNLGYNRIELQQDKITPLISLPSWASAINRQHIYATNKMQSWIIEPQINYEQSFGRSKFNFLLGSTLQSNLKRALLIDATNFSSDNLINNLQAASSIKINNNNSQEYKYSAIYSRIGYSWADKYLVNLTARRDGSSNFGPGKQFGNFGAVGFAWIFSKENFLRNSIPFLSFGKFRASYGSTGNDQLSPYQYLSTYSSLNYSYLGLNGLYPTRLANPSFGWETVNKTEFGLELGFLKDKVLLNASWYKNRTGNQLVGYPLPSVTGFTSVQYNLPAIIQNTGLEISLSTVNVKSNSIMWSTNVNISFPKNKLLSYPDIQLSPYATTYKVGKSLFISDRFHYIGVDSKTGLYTFEDKNDDGSYTYADDRSFVFTGQDFFGGIENSIKYKQFQLSFLFQFVKQRGSLYLYSAWPGFSNNNLPISALKRWRKNGDKNIAIQKYSTFYTSEADLFGFSDGLIGDASFIRLKNISLSWFCPVKLVQKLHLDRVQLYVNCQNALTFTNYTGIDPEYGGALILPPLKMFTAGIRIGF